MNGGSSATRRPRGLVLLLVASLAISAAGHARASAIVRMDLEALSTNAERIFVGAVDEVVSHTASPGGRYIVTDVTLRSERNVRGVPDGSRLVIRHLGGEVGRLGQRVFGEASYSPGERVLVFAVKRQGSYYTLGMSQGALHVYEDATGVRRVRAHLGGAMLLGPPGTADAVERPLDEVLERVRAFVSRRADAESKGR